MALKPDGKQSVEVPIYAGADDIRGALEIKIAKKIEHIGIKVELIGEIGARAEAGSPQCAGVTSRRRFLRADMFYDRGNHSEFTSVVKEISPPGVLTTSTARGGCRGGRSPGSRV